jgi:hypothetical protein
MESSRINEIVIENECFDIFPNQFFMEEISIIETTEENRSLQTQSSVIQSEENKIKKIYRNYMCKEKIGEGMLKMHCVGYFTL